MPRLKRENTKTMATAKADDYTVNRERKSMRIFLDYQGKFWFTILDSPLLINLVYLENNKYHDQEQKSRILLLLCL